MRVVTLVAFALLVLCWSPQTAEPKLIEPPFVRKWTALTGDNTAVIAVREGVVYYRSNDGVGAINLATGQQKWRWLKNAWIPSAALQGNRLYAIANSKSNDARRY
jgi:outer membrane protein assembly factor BamB